MSDAIETVKVMSQRELLAKAKELHALSSFATGALAGLTLYLRGDEDEEVLEMMTEGIRFCELCKRDLVAYDPEAKYRFLPGRGPRYYMPSEVVPSEPDIPVLQQKLESIRGTLNSILRKEERVPGERIQECHSLIEELVDPYRRQAALSLGQFKYGPTLRK